MINQLSISLRENIFFYFLAVTWLAVGIALGNLAIPVITLSVLYLLQKGMYLELFFGFLFVLAIANSREPALQFAKPLREIYIVLLLVPLVLNSRIRVKINLPYYFFPFFLVGLGTLFISVDPQLSFLKLLSYFLILFIVPVYVMHLYETFGDYFLKQIFYFIIVILISGFVIHLVNSELTTLSGRFRGIFGNPNGLSTYILLSAVFMEITRHFKPDIFTNSERYFFLIVAAVALLMSASRTGLFSLLLFYVLIYLFNYSRVLGFSSVIIAGFSYQLIFSYLPDIVYFLNLEDHLRIDSLEAAGGRVVAFEFAWYHIQDSFWFGHGFAYNEYIFGRFYDMLSALGHQGGTHNAYLSMWLDTGLIGLSSFVGAWAILFLKASRVSTIALPFAVVIAFSSFFESWLASSLNHVTILMIMNISLLLILGYCANDKIDE
ncbi:O-antigen ligase family protein [Rhodohalobacter sp. 8-1]|uniref:O-antigen ligase family protein n=1 Tax=Rhodohalobacter sp. 8-1 TaxID=3131972 RepID=UPI0030EB7544